MSVPEAVLEFVHDGDYLASGGFGADRIATALLHEIVRQQKQNLGFAGHTATHDFQILAAGNLTGRGHLLKRVDAAYIIGLEARGLSPHARRVVEICDHIVLILRNLLQLDRPAERFKIISQPKPNRFLVTGNGWDRHQLFCKFEKLH